MVEEKRRYIRWDTKIRVTYSLQQNDESYEEVFTENVSEVGVRVVLKDKIEPKQLLRLKLEFLSDSVPIIVDCKIVYVIAEKDHYRIGAEFVNMNDFQKQRLKRCLEEAQRAPGRNA